MSLIGKITTVFAKYNVNIVGQYLKTSEFIGYSITDISGEHETKNIITGSLNKKNNMLSFSEQEIVYTKSTVNENSFCLPR